ncbi:hypothetical protein CK203_116771 [Vitis vinifera]|uniref:Uncharacterized protein n=1 Tax=Vitis vinifera TaxID=29760 RepID=A0A438FAY4_VITVI|nr:hypothetical protein CK203_116771 [Vitis vinifera]
MPNIEHYSEIGCPKIHLRLYSTVMRAHGIDDTQLVALFPMSLSGVAQRCADIDVSERELEAIGQRPDESIFSFVSCRRAKVAGMIDQPKEQDQIDTVLQNLQARFAKRLVGIPFQDLKSLVHAVFSVEEVIAQGLWTDTAHSLNSKGKKPIGSSSRFGEDLIDLGLVNLSGPSVTINPQPTHSTHAVPTPSSLQKIDLDVDAVQLRALFILIMVVIRVVEFEIVILEMDRHGASRFESLHMTFGMIRETNFMRRWMGGHHFMSPFTISPSHIELLVASPLIFT